MGMRQLKISNSITNRESESLDRYLRDINKIEMITPDEEVELAELIRKGDKNALDKLTRANLRFVVSVAKQYQGQGLSLADLVNEGNLGLIEAARRFDPTRGFRFISFAVWWIRQNILQGIAAHARMVRLPINKVATQNRIRKAHSLLEQQLERSPSAEELAEMLNMDEDEVAQNLGYKNHHVSLDTPLSEEEDGTLIDTIENTGVEKTEEELCHRQSLKMEIDRSFKLLTDKQKETICYFFGIGLDHPLTLDDIAIRMNLTTERVRQIRDKALDKLRTGRNFNSLRSFLGN